MSTPEAEFCKVLKVKKSAESDCESIVKTIFSSKDKALIEEKVKELSRKTGKPLNKVVNALELFQED